MLTHSDLPRISEIVADTHKTYGVVPWEHWSQLSSEPQIKKHFVDLEYYLSSLREHDWAILKQKMVPQFKSKYQDRGWQLAFDLVNEAVAYNILGSRGFQVVSFVKESPKTQTPDLTAKKGNIIWACEVKTINESENEIISRVQGLATSTFVDLDVNFFTKLEKTLAIAAGQLQHVQCERRMIFVVFNFDDSWHEYVDRYFDQIKNWLMGQTMKADQYFFLAMPPFSTRHSQERLHLVWPPD